MKKKLSLLLIFLAANLVSADWIRPSSYASSAYFTTSSCHQYSWGSPQFGIDNDLSTSTGNGGDGNCIYGEYIWYNLNSSISRVLSGVQVTVNFSGTCTDNAHIRLQNATSGTVDKCNFATFGTKATKTCTFTDSASWTQIGFQTGGNGACKANLYDIEYETTLPSSAGSSPITATSGPCRRYCDYELIKQAPINVSSAYNYWKINLTSTGTTSLEGNAELNSNWNNVLITEINGTCSSPGYIYNKFLYTGETPNALLINYSTGNCVPSIDICFNGTYNTGYSYTTKGSDFSVAQNTYDLDGDSYTYYHYNVSYYNEKTLALFNFSGFSGAVSNLLCREPFGGFVEQLYPNITANPIRTYVFQTATPIDFSTEMPYTFMRPLATESGGFYNLYIINQSDYYNFYGWPLKDYTAQQFAGSKLEVQKAIGSNMTTICSDRFGANNLVQCPLFNNTEYRLILTTRDGLHSRNMGVVKCLDPTNTCNDLTVSQPIINDLVGVYADTSYGWVSDYGGSQVGVVINTQTPSVNSTFAVWNASSSPYVLTYSATQSGSTIYSYILPDKTMPVLLDLYISHPTYGDRHFATQILLYNKTSPLNSTAFNNALPKTMLGTSSSSWKKLIVLLLTWFVLYTACKASDYGVGAILGWLCYAAFWWVGFLDQSEIPWVFIIMMGIASFSLKVFERRFQ